MASMTALKKIFFFKINSRVLIRDRQKLFGPDMAQRLGQKKPRPSKIVAHLDPGEKKWPRQKFLLSQKIVFNTYYGFALEGGGLKKPGQKFRQKNK
jgi:hypothetical protein